ncbi:MAG: hypothetical protein WA055_05365 [Candidatus Moraniibacteriota bacterium]
MKLDNPTITEVSEAQVHDGKGGFTIVKPGDQVILNNYEESKALREFLGGTGPLTISWIGEWRCGRKSLYFDTKNGKTGTHANEFRIFKSG